MNRAQRLAKVSENRVQRIKRFDCLDSFGRSLEIGLFEISEYPRERKVGQTIDYRSDFSD